MATSGDFEMAIDIHRRDGAQVAALVHQAGVDLGGARSAKRSWHSTARTSSCSPWGRVQGGILRGRPRGSGSSRWQAALDRLAAVVPNARWHPEGPTGPLDAHSGRPGLDGLVHGFAVFFSALWRDSSAKSAETFPWASISSRAVASSSRNLAASSLALASSAVLRSAVGRPGGRSLHPAKAPSSRWWRHWVISEEYRPSRRQVSSTAPGLQLRFLSPDRHSFLRSPPPVSLLLHAQRVL